MFRMLFANPSQLFRRQTTHVVHSHFARGFTSQVSLRYYYYHYVVMIIITTLLYYVIIITTTLLYYVMINTTLLYYTIMSQSPPEPSSVDEYEVSSFASSPRTPLLRNTPSITYCYYYYVYYSYYYYYYYY